MNLTRILLIILLLTSCITPKISTPPPVVTNRNIQVVYEPGAYSKDDQRQIVEAVNIIVHAWEQDFGKIVPAIFIHIVDTDEFICGQVTNAIGCTRMDGSIWVVRGSRNSLPGLYHELCHRVPASPLYGQDGNHENPLWDQWTNNGYQISEEISNSRGWFK